MPHLNKQKCYTIHSTNMANLFVGFTHGYPGMPLRGAGGDAPLERAEHYSLAMFNDHGFKKEGFLLCDHER